MTVWVVSGLSGAGKATAIGALEAAGLSCVDNLPVELLASFAAAPREAAAAAVIDARQGRALAGFAVPPGVRVLFLDARDDVLVRRLAESTRPHPRADAGRGGAAVTAERAMLQPLRAAADTVIDTSELDATELQRRVRELVLPEAAVPLALTISSFGHKFGPQLEADWVVDARMIKNPFWVPALRPLTGLDPAVRDHVMHDASAQELVARLASLLQWACPRTREHGRRFLHVAIGCTGGRHRSVVLAEALAAALDIPETTVTVRHRDVDKPDPR